MHYSPGCTGHRLKGGKGALLRFLLLMSTSALQSPFVLHIQQSYPILQLLFTKSSHSNVIFKTIFWKEIISTSWKTGCTPTPCVLYTIDVIAETHPAKWKTKLNEDSCNKRDRLLIELGYQETNLIIMELFLTHIFSFQSHLSRLYCYIRVLGKPAAYLP